MITAVDSSVLLDVLSDDPAHRPASFRALEAARLRGRVVACPVVWAEIAAFFASPAALEALIDAGILFDPFDRESAELASRSWAAYRRSGGTRRRLIADFLIAAHARSRADALLTRDRGFTRRYFEDLELIAPAVEE